MRHLLSILALLSATLLSSQQVTFIDHYPFEVTQTQSGADSPEETIEFVLPTSDGGYLLVGNFLWGPNDTDGIIIKVNSSGIEQWRDARGSGGYDYFRSAIQIGNSYYIAGSYEHSTLGTLVWVLKYGLNGQPEDNEFFGLSGQEMEGTTIVETFDGNIIVGGALTNNAAPPNPSTGGFILGLTTALNTIPGQFKVNLGTVVLKIEQTGCQSYWVFGEEYDAFDDNCNTPTSFSLSQNMEYSPAYFSDIFARKFDDDLNQTNHIIIGGQTSDAYVDAIAMDDGGFAILGQSRCESANDDTGPNNICIDQFDNFNPYWIYKANTQGAYHWARSIGGSINSTPFGIIKACESEEIVYSETAVGFIDYLMHLNKVSPFFTGIQGMGSTTFNDEIKGNDLKRGKNNQITVGGSLYQNNNEDMAFFRFTEESLCFNRCDIAIPLQCGQTYFGSTTNASNDFNLNDFCCFDFDINEENNPFNAGDALFLINKSGTGDLQITLSSSVDHDIFLFSNCSSGAMNCYDTQSYSIEPISGQTNNEVISIPNAPQGEYYIVVDGYDDTQEGAFSLTATCCTTPIFDYECESLTYTYDGSGLVYTFSANNLNNYAANEDWLINQTTVSASMQGATYAFPDDGTYTVCAPYFNAEGCIDYCCTEYCIRALPMCLEGLIPPCDEECLCTELPNTYLPKPFQCETFDNYTAFAPLTPQSENWSLEFGALDAMVEQPEEEGNVLHLAYNGEQSPEVLYHLNDGNNNNLQCGRYRLSWEMQVEEGSSAGFRILYDKNVPVDFDNTSTEVFFNSDGRGYIAVWDDNTNDTINIPFGYAQGVLIKPMFIIDLDANQNDEDEDGKLEFWLSERLIYATSYKTSLSEAYEETLGALAFFGNQNSDYTIDNICIRTAQDLGCMAGDETICIQNGERYDNICQAGQLGLYTGNELEVCISICDYGGEYIGRNDGELITSGLLSFELAPNFLYSDPDVIAQYPDGVPFPLYTDLYIFENEEGGIIDINFNSGGSPAIVLVYQCVSNDDIVYSPVFIGERGDINNDPLPGGFYYILVLNEGLVEEYGISVNPSGPCEINNSDILPCGSTITGNFTDLSNHYQHQGSISNCYNGNRVYEDIGKLYRLEVDVASIVNIELDAEGGPGGVFVFGSACGSECVAYAETSLEGGLATVENISLASGFYYIAIFEEASIAPIDSFTLSINCSINILNSTLFDYVDDDCEIDSDSFHIVAIDFDEINDASLSSTDIFSLRAKPPVNSGAPAFIYTNHDVNYVQDQNIIFPPLYEYSGTDNANRCSYISEDTIVLYISREEDVARPCRPTFRPDTGNTLDAGNIFSPGDTSQIVDYAITSIGITVLTHPGTFFTFTEEASTKTIEFTVTLGHEWEFIPSQDWISIIETEGPFLGNKDLIISVEENTGFEERTGQIIWQTTNDPVFSKTITIRQLAPCRIPNINFPTIENDTIKVCASDSILLSAEVPGIPDSLYQFFWNDEKANSSNYRIIPPLPIGETIYPLRIEQKSCPSAFTDTTIIIIVTEIPDTPLVEDVSYCSDEQVEALSVNNITTDQTANWYTSFDSDSIIATGAIFIPNTSGEFWVEIISETCISERVSAINTIGIPFSLALDAEQNQVCVGTSINITALITGNATNLTNTWSNNVNGTGEQVTFLSNAAGLFPISLTVVADSICSQVAEINVEVGTMPAFESDLLFVIEENCSADLLTYHFAFTTDGQLLNASDIPGNISIDDSQYMIEAIPVGVDFDIHIGNVFCDSIYTVNSPNCDCPTSIPVPNIGTSEVICEGDDIPTLFITVSDNEIYTAYWYDSPETNANLVNIGLEYTPAAPGTYFVETVLIEANTCTSPGRVPISLTEIPAINLMVTASDFFACEGELITLNANATGGSNSDNLRYNWNGGLGEEALITIPAALGSHTFFVSVTDENSTCQEVIGVITIEGIATPTSLTSVAPHCINQDAYALTIITDADEVSISSGVGVIENDENNYQFIIPADSSILIKISNIVNGIICSNYVNVNAPDCACEGNNISPAIAIQSMESICLGGSTATLEVLPPPEGLIVLWFDNPEMAGDPLHQGIAYETSVAGTYYAFIIDPDTNCASSIGTSIILIVNDRPVADAGEDEVTCFGDWVQLNGAAGSSGIAPLSYQWVTTIPISDNTIATPEVQAIAENISLTLIITDGNGCTNTDILNIQTTALPNPSITETESILCFADSTGLLEVNHTSEYLPVSVIWSTSATSFAIENLPAGTYSLTMTDDNDCEQTASYELLAPPLFIDTDTINNSIINNDGQLTPGALAVAASGGTPPYSFLWTDDNAQEVSNDSIFTTDMPGEYNLDIIDQNGCLLNFDFTLDVIVGLSTIEGLGILKLFPNPTNDKVYLEVDLFQKGDLSLILRNGFGQEVKTFYYDDIQQQRFDIDMHAFPDGIFWLQIKINDSAIINKKIIKIH